MVVLMVVNLACEMAVLKVVHLVATTVEPKAADWAGQLVELKAA